MVKQKQAYKPIEAGFSIFDKKHKDEILVDPLFVRAKKGDARAAQELIEQYWTDQKTEELKFILLPDRQPVFFSVPGTSRLNQVPLALARFMAKKTREHHSLYLIGDEHIASLHTSMMKSLKNGDRLMAPRLYEAYDPQFFRRINEIVPNAQLILVEDILTTGTSVNTFRRFLEHNGLHVDRIAALKGDTQISPTQAELDKLQKMAQKVHLMEDGSSIDIRKLGAELTHAEVVSLSYHYLGERYRKADKATKRLMRRQLACLYDVKVNHHYESAQKLEKLSTLIKRREEINGTISQNKEENRGGKIIGLLRGLQVNEKKAQQELSTNTGRQDSAGRSQSNADYVQNFEKEGIRNNANPERSSENRFECGRPGSSAYLHTPGKENLSGEDKGKRALTFLGLKKQNNIGR